MDDVRRHDHLSHDAARSRRGVLFALDQVEGGRVRIAEATEVSPGVSDRDFAVPSA